MSPTFGPARGAPLVLCYHAVSDVLDSGLAVTRRQLRSHLRILAARGLRSVTFAELERMRARGDSTAGVMAITFDDGYASMLPARDILGDFGFVATTYVLPPTIGAGRPLRWPGIEKWSDGPHASELVPLDWDQAASLVASGWEIGSHTLTHPRLTRVALTEAEDELARSREAIADRVGECVTVAYPFGTANDAVAEAARRAGYEAGTTLGAWHRHDDRFQRPRVGIYRHDGERRFKLKIAGFTRSLRALPQLVNSEQSVGAGA